MARLEMFGTQTELKLAEKLSKKELNASFSNMEKQNKFMQEKVESMGIIVNNSKEMLSKEVDDMQAKVGKLNIALSTKVDLM
jgi:hypothetical protein